MEFKNTATRNVLENIPSAIHKLIVSISCGQISAWHGATAGMCLCLKTATNLSSLILWVSFSCIWPVNFLSLHPCSRVSYLWWGFFCSFFFPLPHQILPTTAVQCARTQQGRLLDPQPSQGLCLQGLWWLHRALLLSLPAVQILTHGRVHRSVTLVTLLPGRGDARESWFVSQLKNKALHQLFSFLSPYFSLLKPLLEYCIQITM